METKINNQDLQKFGILFIAVWSTFVFNMIAIYSAFLSANIFSIIGIIISIIFAMFTFPLIFIFYFFAKMLKEKYLKGIEDKKTKLIVEKIVPLFVYFFMAFIGYISF
jgi:hypothetical protein